MKIRRRRNVFSPSKKFSPAGRRRSLPFLLSFFLPFLPPVSPRPPSSHHPHQTKNASRPRERAQSRGRHPLPRVRLPDPLQEADEASRAVRGEVEAERKKKVDATRKRGDTNRESRASAEFCFPLVLSTTTGPLPALIPPRAEREIGSPACLVNVVKMTERKRKKKTWRGRKEEREDQDEDQTHFSLALWAFSTLRSLSVLRSSLSPILHRSPAPHLHRQPMSDVPRHRGSGGSEQKSSHDDDGTGAMIPPSTSSPPPHHHQTSSIPLPTALSNALDLRPGAWPEGHPMSRARSDGDLKEITWLTAKVRRRTRFSSRAFSIERSGDPARPHPKRNEKPLTRQVDLLERQVAALIAASPSSARTAVADAMSRIPSSVALNYVEDEETKNNITTPAAAAAAASSRPSASMLPPRPPSQVFLPPSCPSPTPPTLAETARPPMGEPVASEDGGGGAAGASGASPERQQQQQQRQQEQQQAALTSSVPPPMPFEPVPMSATRVVLHQLVTPTDVDDLGICSGE